MRRQSAKWGPVPFPWPGRSLYGCDGMTIEQSTPRLQAVAAAARTTTGSVRADNQDRWGQHDHNWFVVADGMGGHEGGEVAAEAVVQGFLARHGSQPDWSTDMPAVNEEVRQALTAAGLGIGGSTVVGLCLTDVPTIVHVGDSRAYVLRANQTDAELLTQDHNVETELLAAGQSVEWYRSQFGRTDALTRYLGGEGTAVPTITELNAQAGDRMLLCSDGVHGYIELAELSSALGKASPAEAADALIAASLAAGGHDNATVVVVDLEAGHV